MASMGTITEGQTTPVGDYILKLKDVTTEDSQFDDGQYRKWIFVVESIHYSDEDDAQDMIGEELWGTTTTSLATKSRSYAWVRALSRP